MTAATAITFALSSAVHSHRAANHLDARQTPASPTLQAWTGELADVKAPDFTASAGAPITSASLVVPKSQLALPDAPVRALVRLHGCDDSLCTSRVATPPPPHRPSTQNVDVAASAKRPASRQEKATLVSRLNLWNRLPDAAALGHPFSVAGNTVAGWFKRF